MEKDPGLQTIREEVDTIQERAKFELEGETPVERANRLKKAREQQEGVVEKHEKPYHQESSVMPFEHEQLSGKNPDDQAA